MVYGSGLMWLHSFQQFSEFCQCNDIDIRKWCLTEYIKMMVVGDNISGSSSNSTINKLVIIRICLNHLEMIVGGDKFNERTIDNGLNNQFCSLIVCQTLQNLKVLFQYLIGYTKHMLPLHQRLPNNMVTTLTGYALNQTVSVKDNLHRLFQFVEIHLVDFVESLLIKLPRLPQCIKPILHFSRIMAVKYVLQLLEPIWALVQGEHLKQMNLQRIENGCFHNYYCLFDGKDGASREQSSSLELPRRSPYSLPSAAKLRIISE